MCGYAPIDEWMGAKTDLKLNRHTGSVTQPGRKENVETGKNNVVESETGWGDEQYVTTVCREMDRMKGG